MTMYKKPKIEWQETDGICKSVNTIRNYTIRQNGTGNPNSSKPFVIFYNSKPQCYFDSVAEAKEWVKNVNYPSVLADYGFEPVSEPLADTGLIEELEQQIHAYLKKSDEALTDDYAEMERNTAIGLKIALDIVKQHQSWRNITSDEKPQDMQACNLLLKNDSAEYPTIYSVGLFRQYASGHVWLSLVETEKYIDESEILAWQPMSTPSDEFFESLYKPPSEVQDD